MPGRGNFSSTVTRVLINSRTAPMGSSMETGERRIRNLYFLFFSFFVSNEISNIPWKDRYLFEIGVLDIGKEKKVKSVKTNRNRAHCI